MKPSIKFLLFTVLALVVSCGENTEELVEPSGPVFEFPKLKGDGGSGEYINSTVQLSPRIYILENTSPTNTTFALVDLPYYKRTLDPIPDSLNFSLSNNIELHVDYSQEFTIKYIDRYLPPRPEWDESGNNEPRGYSPFDSAKVFPAYIVNYTDSVQGILEQGNIIVIQEALNIENEWIPIEYFEHAR